MPGVFIVAAADLNVPAAAAAPFALLLAAIAILPILAGHWWHANRNKGIIAALIGGPVAIGLLFLDGGTAALLHGLEEYVSFIVLLGALYIIAGGIVLTGDLPAHPTTNVAFLALGAILANFIGTTGASMLLVRPLLRTNSERQRVRHVPIFFIFIVSNCGGLLTPLGDPPLFLGYLNGVDFFWTLSLWKPWIIVNGLLLLTFLIWDSVAYRRERLQAITRDNRQVEPLRIRGHRLNGALLIGVIATVLLRKQIPAFPWCDLMLALLAAISWIATPRGLRKNYRFAWAPIVEVAVLFVAIFITMVPALALLNRHGQSLGVTEPWQYFWITGLLSSMLDNAPTYVTLATLADTVGGCGGIGNLSTCRPDLLAAVSCGAVFLGAGSYIGNGPNFMVKAIAEESGYQMPSFFGYLLYAVMILGPIMAIMTALFFV
jgi:Na+/H+ antiporter NhaD/arsenite permease-like protein